MTPAEVAEVLMRNDDTDVALHDLVELLKLKKKDAIEIESKQAEEKKEANEIKTESMEVDGGDEIKTGSVQVEEKKDDKEAVVKNEFTENGSG